MKSNILRTTLTILLTCAFIISGCSSSGNDSDNSSEIQEDTITMDWYVNYSWFVTDWGENMVSKKITEETGIDVNFITPMGNETNKLNTLIDSNTLPDIVTIGW